MVEVIRDLAPSNRCPQCDAPADVGQIFCKKCGASLRPPKPLTQHIDDGNYASREPKSLVRQILVFLLKGVAGIAAVTAIFCPLRTFKEISLFVGAVFVALGCYFVLTNMDEAYVEDYGKDGYWPKPLDWSARGKTEGSSSENTSGR